jgi:hypothetical protein
VNGSAGSIGFVTQEWPFSAISAVWHDLCNILSHGAGSSGAGSGRKTMTFNATMSQLAVSIVGALVAATLFVSAAVGPAGQLI